MTQKVAKNNIPPTSHMDLEDENLMLCQQFKIRPPLFQVPQLTINQHFDTFKIKLKKVTISGIELKVKSFSDTFASQQQKTPKKTKKIVKEKPKNHTLIQISSDSQQQIEPKAIKIESIDLKLSSNNKQNLTSYSLHEIIYLLYSHNLMLQYYYKIFDTNFIIDEEQSFQMLRKQEQQHDFTRTLFTFMDHRMLAEILVIGFGTRYYISQDEDSKQDGVLGLYYRQMYQKPFSDYIEEWDHFNTIHRRTWMPSSSNILTDIEYFNELH